MNDRELLRAAAKAADLTAIFDTYGWCEITGGAFFDANEPPTVWNPLTDDGDALRLAVALWLKLETNADSQFCGATTTRKEFIELWSDNGDDAQRAMRHVIVRAAASMAASES